MFRNKKGFEVVYNFLESLFLEKRVFIFSEKVDNVLSVEIVLRYEDFENIKDLFLEFKDTYRSNIFMFCYDGNKIFFRWCK